MNTAIRPPPPAAASSWVSSMLRGGPGYIPDRLTTPSMPHSSISRTARAIPFGPMCVWTSIRWKRRGLTAGGGTALLPPACAAALLPPAPAATAAPGASRRHPIAAASTSDAASGTTDLGLTSGLGGRQDLDFGLLLGRLGGRFRLAAGALQLNVELERLRAALAARPVGAADHPLLRLEAVLLERDRVRAARIHLFA